MVAASISVPVKNVNGQDWLILNSLSNKGLLRAFSTFSLSLILSRISSLSNSATAPITCRKKRPCGVSVSKSRRKDLVVQEEFVLPF